MAGKAAVKVVGTTSHDGTLNRSADTSDPVQLVRGPSLAALGGSGDRAAYEVASVRNALLIVSLLREYDEVTLSEISRRLEIRLSTTHRLLRTLRGHGFIQQDGSSRKYSLGPTMREEVGAPRFDDYASAAADAMNWMNSVTGETVHLAVARGTSVHYLAALRSPQPSSIASRTGGEAPAHSTSIGKILLASLPQATLSKLYPMQTLEGPTKNSTRTRESLESELRITRRTGYARNASESEHEVSALAFAVRDNNGIPTMAISVAVPRDRLELSPNPFKPTTEEAKLLRIVATAARRIERELTA